MILSPHKVIQSKVLLSFLLFVVILITLGIIILEGLFTLGHLTTTIYKHPLVVSNSALHAALNITKMHHGMKNVVLTTSPGEMIDSLSEVAEAEEIVHHELDTIRNNILGEEGQRLEDETRQLFFSWAPIREEVVWLLESDRRHEAILLTQEKCAEHGKKLEQKMLELTSYARYKASDFFEQALKGQLRLEHIVRLTVGSVILVTLIAFIALYRVMKTEKGLRDEKSKLQEALNEIKTLRGIIPICSSCKQIRDDQGSWSQIERYIRDHSEAEFSHSICPKCSEKYYEELNKCLNE